MNWDISIGRWKQFCGRVLQITGQQFHRRKIILLGEQVEYRGRLQMRYGWLKHQEQWGSLLARIPRQQHSQRVANAHRLRP